MRISVWQDGFSVGELWRRSPGFLLSFAAVAAGAPFWFSVLKRAMALRRPPPAGAAA